MVEHQQKTEWIQDIFAKYLWNIEKKNGSQINRNGLIYESSK